MHSRLRAGSAYGTVCAGTAPAAVHWQCRWCCLRQHSAHSAQEMLLWPDFQMWAPLAPSGQLRCRQCTGSAHRATHRQELSAACWQRAQCTACVGSAGSIPSAVCPGSVQAGSALLMCSVGRVQAARRQGVQRCPGSMHGAVHWLCAQGTVCRQHPCYVHGTGRLWGSTRAGGCVQAAWGNAQAQQGQLLPRHGAVPWHCAPSSAQAA